MKAILPSDIVKLRIGKQSYDNLGLLENKSFYIWCTRPRINLMPKSFWSLRCCKISLYKEKLTKKIIHNYAYKD